MAVVGGFLRLAEVVQGVADGLQQGLALARQAGLQLGEVGQALGAGSASRAAPAVSRAPSWLRSKLALPATSLRRRVTSRPAVVGERPITYGSDAGGLGGAIQAHVAGLRLCRHGAEAYTGFSVPE